MVPLQLCDKNFKSILWQNPFPSSARYCGDIKYIFTKETVEMWNCEIEKVKEQISSFFPTNAFVDNLEISITCKLILCMIDGKVCNSLSCSSTQTCYLCGAKPRDMNNPTILAETPIKNVFVFRSFSSSLMDPVFECLLHISYRLQIKTRQASGEENKTIVSIKKKQIQEDFKRELSLWVDMPKQQAGNTNDGNTVRKFFRNARKTLKITGLNFELIHRFRIILECINSSFD